ncbi:MAG: AlpA family transcriptional regulator [Steroidobacter sp.]
MVEKVLKLPEVIQRTGKKKTPIYAGAKSGEFPKPIKLGKRAVGWKESDIEAWIASRPDAQANSSISSDNK